MLAGIRESPDPSHLTFHNSPLKSGFPLRMVISFCSSTAYPDTEPRNTGLGGVLKSVTQTPASGSFCCAQMRKATAVPSADQRNAFAVLGTLPKVIVLPSWGSKDCAAPSPLENSKRPSRPTSK